MFHPSFPFVLQDRGQVSISPHSPFLQANALQTEDLVQNKVHSTRDGADFVINVSAELQFDNHRLYLFSKITPCNIVVVTANINRDIKNGHMAFFIVCDISSPDICRYRETDEE